MNDGAPVASVGGAIWASGNRVTIGDTGFANAAAPSRPQDADARRFNLADLRELLPGVPVAPCPHLSDLETATLAAAGRRLRADLGL